jgi:hypothetical protein
LVRIRAAASIAARRRGRVSRSWPEWLVSANMRPNRRNAMGIVEGHCDARFAVVREIFE